MLRTLLLACLPVGASLLLGCGGPKSGTDVGNGRQISLQIRAYEELAQRSTTLQDGARIDELWMVVGRIRLRPGADCDSDDSEVDIRGPVVVDLLGGTTPAMPLLIDSESGSFCELRIAFEKAETGELPAGAPAGLADQSILMRGVRADGTAFEVVSDVNDEYKLGPKTESFQLPVGGNPLLLAYELGAWMEALDLDNLMGDPVLVTKDENSGNVSDFEDAVKKSVKLVRDGDDDGVLDAEELDEENELAESEEEEQ